MKRTVLVLMAVGVWFAAQANGQRQDSVHQNTYRAIEMASFSVEPDIVLPDDYVVALDLELMRQLRRIKKCERVFRADSQQSLTEPVLQLTGVVKAFNPGSRAKRYLIGFGAGQTKLVAHVQFIDAATGNVVFEDYVDGKVWMGPFGGDSMGAARGLAKEVAKVTRRRFFK